MKPSPKCPTLIPSGARSLTQTLGLHSLVPVRNSECEALTSFGMTDDYLSVEYWPTRLVYVNFKKLLNPLPTAAASYNR